ncbi:MAG: lysophospholipid acyltransferase family protein [Candidatus Omnitrophica bacterium]|jgi:KDO2-lipid IV(A) lauroyltransferase|nr:lysophospholipid acyltransferase family protein [Candidatus Omnitrophota bacterium]
MKRTRKEKFIDIIAYVIIFGVYESIKYIPLQLDMVISKILGNIFYYMAPSLREKIMYNLKIVFENNLSKDIKNIEFLTKKIISETFLNIFEFSYWTTKTTEELEKVIEIQGMDILEKIKKQKKPVIAISGHNGNFIIMLAYLAIKNKNFSWIERTANNIYLAEFMRRLQKNREIDSISKINMKEAIIIAQKWLRKGNILALLIDQHSGEGVEVNLLGKKVFAPIGVEILARKFDCSVIGVFIYRTHRFRHRIIIEGPYPVQRTKDLKKDTVFNTQMFYNRIEKYVLLHPEQWFTWLHKRFRH